jgi:hypothetical protein
MLDRLGNGHVGDALCAGDLSAKAAGVCLVLLVYAARLAAVTLCGGVVCFNMQVVGRGCGAHAQGLEGWDAGRFFCHSWI